MMPDNIEQEAINKLTSAGSALKDPFSNLERILFELSHFKGIKKQKKTKPQVPLASIPKSKKSYSENLKKVLFDLGEMFKVCRNCRNRTLNDELINGICFDCHIKSEQSQESEEALKGDLDPLTARIGKLEAQVKAIKTGYQAPRVYMSDIKAEILSALRKDLQTEISNIKGNMSRSPKILPQKSSSSPPPIPSNIKHASFSINFSEMTIDELRTFTPEFLESLPVLKRNQYNDRLKVLQLIEKMTPKQREEYEARKKREKEHAEKLDDLKDSLMNLDESENSLFLKMKEKAEKSTLSGKGTLGVIDSKIVYIYCHNCNKTNEVTEGEDIKCRFCKEPLDLR